MSRVLNAFQGVRPRGAVAAPVRTPLPRRSKTGNDTASIRVLDVNGKPMATLAPRRYGGGPVLSRAQSQAQNDRTRAIVRGGI